jgi:hypothetical protein
MDEGRFVLLLDILGFKHLVAKEPLPAIGGKIKGLLAECERWAAGRLPTGFDTILFSDTVLIYTKGTGFRHEWYDDLVFIGSRICCSMFAAGIPMRGAMSYGSFFVENSGRHQIYLGQALIHAHEAAEPRDQGRDFMGFKVTSATWRRRFPGPEAVCKPGRGIVQHDDSLLINVFEEFQGDSAYATSSELEHYFSCRGESDDPWPQTELSAFRFIRDMERKHAAACATHSVARKYANTIQFIRKSFGEHLYEVANALADDHG